MTMTFCPRLQWVLGLWILLVVTTLTPPAIFAYDGQNQLTIAYDTGGESNVGYDAVSALATGEKQNATAGNRLLFAKFGESLAADEGGWVRQLEQQQQTGLAAKDASKVFSKEKQALVDMAKADKRAGITKADMQAYKDLNKQLSDPFPANKVRGPEVHTNRGPQAQQPHGHVGPVDYIPIN